MKKLNAILLALLLLLNYAEAQTSTITINTSTGLINIPPGSATPNFTALNIGGSTATIPSQGGNSGKFLTTNGTVASWSSPVTSLAGTAHQVIVSGSTGAVTLTLPQAIDTTSSPTFANLTVTTLNGMTITPSTGTLTIANGVTLTATTSGTLTSVAYTVGATGGAGAGDNGKVVIFGAAGGINAYTFNAGSGGGSTSDLQSTLLEFINSTHTGQITPPTLGGNRVWTLPDKTGTFAMTSDVTANLILPSQGGNSGKYLTTDGTNSSWGTVTAGVSSITGTANQVIASASTGAITLSLPQSIGTGSSPTFAGLTVTVSATDSSALTPTVAIADSRLLNKVQYRQAWAQGFSHDEVADGRAWQDDSAGGGATGLNYGQCYIHTTASAGARATAYRPLRADGVTGDNYDVTNFGRERWHKTTFCAGVSARTGNNTLGTNGKLVDFWGQTAAHGTPASKGIGFQVEDAAANTTTCTFKVLTYDTSLHTSASLANIDFQSTGTNGAKVHTFVWHIDGLGNVDFWLDDTYLTTVATAPTGTASGSGYEVMELTNGADAVDYNVLLLSTRDIPKP